MFEKMKQKFEKQRDTPGSQELESLLNLKEQIEKAEENGKIEAEQVKKEKSKEKEENLGQQKARLKQLLQQYFMLAKNAGFKEAKVSGSGKDKLFLMTMINTGLTTMVAVLIVLTNFLL